MARRRCKTLTEKDLMHFAKFRLHNYKGFLHSPELHFSPGRNVIVGPNNVGKTALIEGLSLRFGNNCPSPKPCPPRLAKGPALPADPGAALRSR